MLLGSSLDLEIVQNMCPVASSVRIGSIWLAFTTGENALEDINAL